MSTSPTYHITAVGHAIVDVIAPCDEAFLTAQDLTRGAMTLVDDARSAALYDAMAAGVEASGGSAGNTVAGAASFGARCAYIGKVADDQLGDVFRHDLKAQGAFFGTEALTNGPATGRCLINVTPDGQRTMATCLGAASKVGPEDVDAALVADSRILYLEGYLFDSLSGRAAFERACAIAGEAGRTRAMTLSDTFVVDRWRSDLLDFITHAIDLVFANEAELLALFETSDFNRALNSLREIAPLAAVTRSDQGSVIVQGDEIHLVPVYPVDQVLDTTGAGDQYAAGFMFGLSHDLSLETCGRLGSLAAAEVISHYGPRPMVSLRDLARTHKLIKDI